MVDPSNVNAHNVIELSCIFFYDNLEFGNGSEVAEPRGKRVKGKVGGDVDTILVRQEPEVVLLPHEFCNICLAQISRFSATHLINQPIHSPEKIVVLFSVNETAYVRGDDKKLVKAAAKGSVDVPNHTKRTIKVPGESSSTFNDAHSVAKATLGLDSKKGLREFTGRHLLLCGRKPARNPLSKRVIQQELGVFFIR
jgi:hypothetical protein